MYKKRNISNDKVGQDLVTTSLNKFEEIFKNEYFLPQSQSTFFDHQSSQITATESEEDNLDLNSLFAIDLTNTSEITCNTELNNYVFPSRPYH